MLITCTIPTCYADPTETVRLRSGQTIMVCADHVPAVRTSELRPGDRFRFVSGQIRTVKTNTPPVPDGTTHLLTTHEGPSLASQADTCWELPPDDRQQVSATRTASLQLIQQAHYPGATLFALLRQANQDIDRLLQERTLTEQKHDRHLYLTVRTTARPQGSPDA